jgi:glycosyltransferase involved in cell wall biosynthesis
MPRGSGALVLHAELAKQLAGYRLRTYSPWWTLLPPLLPWLGRGGADLIHNSADYGIWFKRRDVPLVVTLHNYVSDRFMRDYSSRLQYLHYRTDLRWFTRRTLLAADATVAVSHFVADLTRQDLGLERAIPVIYNGVDEQRFTPSSQPRTGRPFRVLFSGNLSRRKRAELLAPLAARLGPAFEIWFTAGLGAAPTAPAGAGLHCVGRVAHTDMPELYRSVDALFMPSVREGFGLAAAEAMACGLPVVGCNQSALPELVVDGQGGVLCGIDDLEGYAAALRQLAEDRSAAANMGAFNRARVEQRFTLRQMGEGYRALFQAVADGDSAGFTG